MSHKRLEPRDLGNSISCGRNTHPPRIFQGKVIGYAADDFPREVAKTDIDVQAAKRWWLSPPRENKQTALGRRETVIGIHP